MKKKILLILSAVLLVAALTAGAVLLINSFKKETPSKGENEKTELSDNVLTLLVGESKQLKLNNATEPTKFTSSDPSVAKVDDTGKVSALAKGQTEIICTSGDKSYTCYVFVNAKSVGKEQFPTYDDTEFPNAALSINSGSKGDYVTTTFYVSDFEVLSAFSAELIYDEACLEFVRCVPVGGGIDYVEATPKENGVLFVGAIGYTTNAIQDGKLLQFIFKIKDDAVGNLATVSFVDSDFNMFVYVEDGKEKTAEATLRGCEIEILP